MYLQTSLNIRKHLEIIPKTNTLNISFSTIEEPNLGHSHTLKHTHTNAHIHTILLAEGVVEYTFK